MKKIWARIGMSFEVSDNDYEELKIAMANNDETVVNNLLFNSNHYVEGNSYLPADCDDNPNDDDFEF